MSASLTRANLFGREREQFIKKFHRKLEDVHSHDNDKSKDLYLPLGCGDMDWKRITWLLKRFYDETITLEVFSKDKDYVPLSEEKLIKLWNKL